MNAFSKLYIEKDILLNPHGNLVLKKLKKLFTENDTHLIDNYQDIFQKFYKPYLQKRTNLNIFIAQKKGQLVKKAPKAYAGSEDNRYYFIHAYNCLYECNYCYLQGFFKSPDLVIFINHQEIINEIEGLIIKERNEFPNRPIWFHAGEYSDSLALSHLSQELPLYFNFFKKYPQAFLELRTKSNNVNELLKLPPENNIITSFSLSPQSHIKANDLNTPSLKLRLKAIKKLKEKRHPLALHLDPIMYTDNFKIEYQELLQTIIEEIPLSEFRYISLGVIRFTKEVYQKVKEHYPEASYLNKDLMTKSNDNKYKAIHPLRFHMLQTIKELCLNFGANYEGLYSCMEQEDEINP